MTNEAVWIDGEVMERADAVIGVDDRGFLLGHAAFETMRWTQGRLRRWDAHRARLEGGLAYLGVECSSLLDRVPQAAAELARRLNLTDAAARLTVSAGEGGGGLVLRPQASAHMVLTLKARPAPPSSVSVQIVDGARRSGAPGERFKLSGYADLIAARRDALAQGADRAVVTGPGGRLACADCANLFWISEDAVRTPALDVGALAGVTRTALIAAARAHKIEVAEVRAEARDLITAEAAFMTNALEGLVAISTVNGQGKRMDHPLMTRLRELEGGCD